MALSLADQQRIQTQDETSRRAQRARPGLGFLSGSTKPLPITSLNEAESKMRDYYASQGHIIPKLTINTTASVNNPLLKQMLATLKAFRPQVVNIPTPMVDTPTPTACLG